MKKAVRNRIISLEKKNGQLTPDMVIEDAKDPKSPLHKYFEWDVEKAAMEQWRTTARTLIRQVTVVIKDEKRSISVPSYVHTPQKNRKQCYTNIVKVKSNKQITKEAMHAEIARLKGVIERVSKLVSILGFEEEFNQLIKVVEKIENKIA